LRKYSATPKCFAQNSKKPEFTGWKFQREKQAAKKLFWGESVEESSSRMAARNGADF
jgi:hypothetical protein